MRILFDNIYTTMNRIRTLALIFLAQFVMYGCNVNNTEFEGTRISDETRFILEFDILNSTESHELALKVDDIIDVSIDLIKGELDISVTDVEGKSIYKADQASSNVFSLIISEDGIYTFKVTGRRASGRVSFTLRE